ncbi:12405_t:CDS:10, partial [Racocetra persica]
MKFGKLLQTESVPEWRKNIYDSPNTYEHSDSLQTFPFSPIKEEDKINENSNVEITKPNLSDPTIKSQLEPEEIAFFEALDIELKKITEFYEEKELNAKEHFKQINQAYEDLKALKNVKQSNSPRSDWTSKLFKERDNNNSPVPSTNEFPVAFDYKDARKRMKKAICEFYRGAEMLKNYRNINYAGFKKILEKFDMITKLNGSEIYMQKIEKSGFVKSKPLNVLMRDTEYIYTKLFGGNSRSHAIKKLRTPNRKHKTYYLPTIRSGIYIGLATLSLYNTLKHVNESEEGIQQLSFYAGMILPAILLLIIGVHMVISPFVGIEFRDFFIADHFSSLSYSLVTLQLIPCFVSQEICNLPISITPLAPILGSFGAAMRAVQCIRRYYDTNAVIHLANTGKYIFALVAINFIFYWRYTVAYDADNYNKILISKILFIIVQIISTIYSNIWDLNQDWALLQSHSSNFLLRDELSYKHKWIYYIAMFINFGEMFRRWQWDIFRIEKEHVINCQEERAIKELKLPTIFDSTITEKIQIQKSPMSPQLNRLNSWRDFQPKLDKNE